MMCQCCRVDVPEKHIFLWAIPGEPVTGVVTCKWCLWMLKGFIMSVIHGHNLKIQWGNRSIYRPHWIEVKKFLGEHFLMPDKTPVIEYGAGLTTELLVLEGYDLTTLEPNADYARMCQRIHRHVYPYKENEGPPILAKRFDFALVDAPQGQGARWREMEHAVKHTDGYIYMHDPEENQVRVLEDNGWLPMEKWSKVKFHRFYEAPP